MQYTPNYNLQKSDGNDVAGPAPFNANADTIDAQLYLNQQHRADGSTHIGTAQKTAPVDADSLVIVDSVDGKGKRLLWSKVKALFAAATHRHGWADIDSKPSSFSPSGHKSTHKTGGSDAITPADIGAYTKDETLNTATKILLGLVSTAVPDDALKSLASGSYDIISGSYTGDDSLGRFINVGRTCSIVFSMAQIPSINDNLVHIGIRTSSYSTGLYTNAYGSGFYAYEGYVDSTGFYTSYVGSGGVSVSNNKSGVTYYYYAFCKKG